MNKDDVISVGDFFKSLMTDCVYYIKAVYLQGPNYIKPLQSAPMSESMLGVDCINLTTKCTDGFPRNILFSWRRLTEEEENELGMEVLEMLERNTK